MNEQDHLKTLEAMRDTMLNLGQIHENNGTKADALSFAISAIERSRWVAVSERLPEDDGKYQVQYRFPYESWSYPAVTEFFTEGEDPAGWEPIAGIHESAEVVAWKEIEPYTPKEAL